MRILVLQGMPNTGKTRTIDLVWEELTKTGGVGISTNRKVEGNPVENDFSDIVMIGNRKIAFFSMGDYSNYLSEAIYYYLYQGCDMLICALSTNSLKQNANKALNKYNAIRIDKTVDYTNTQVATNIADAQAILKMI